MFTNGQIILFILLFLILAVYTFIFIVRKSQNSEVHGPFHNYFIISLFILITTFEITIIIYFSKFFFDFGLYALLLSLTACVIARVAVVNAWRPGFLRQMLKSLKAR